MAAQGAPVAPGRQEAARSRKRRGSGTADAPGGAGGMMDYSGFAFPKRGDDRPEPVKTYPDGREVCNLATAAGRREYEGRIDQMADRQGWRCCLEGESPVCPGSLKGHRATFEHEFGRGAGGAKRDDRITLPDGRWINGAAHAACNSWKGSRYIPYNDAHNAVGYRSPTI